MSDNEETGVHWDTKACVHRCALCSEVVVPGVAPEFARYLTMIAAHHAVCPRRPIEVGDTVEIRYCNISRLNGRVGTVVEIDAADPVVPFRVTVDEADRFGWWCRAVERIPRPDHVQAIKVGDYVRWESPVIPDRSWVEGEVVAIDDWIRISVDRAGSAIQTALGEVGGYGRSAIRHIPRPGQCGAHDTAATRIKHEEKLVSERYSEPPAPALIDGITRDACLARWMENRLAVEGGAAPPSAMTRMQRDVGRTMWQQTYGAARSAELDARVAADAADRQVRVTPEFDPCD